MQMRNRLFAPFAIALLQGTVTPSIAQTTPAPASNSANAANTPEKGPSSDWDLRIGAAAAVSPNFLGSKDYSLKAVPTFEVRYKDRFFLSPLGGAGVELLKTSHFHAGPLLALDVGRRESGKALFQITGSRSSSLIGLGEIKASIAAGGFVEYRSEHFSASARITKSLSGDNGIIAQLGARYATNVSSTKNHDQPINFSIGPKISIVDNIYNNAYFGVNDIQSKKSGLYRYNAKGGLQSYGLGSTLRIPLARNLSTAVIASYDHLSGDAADSPLVVQRGSTNQASAFLAFDYHFGV